MSVFMVGMNTYNNGVKSEMGRTDAAMYPARDGTETAGRMAGEGVNPKEQKLPWVDEAQREEESGDGFRKKEPGEECQTCKNRKYKDGSDENVSFKAAAHISPEAAASRVRAHEGEHVANAYSKASEKGGKVLSASVRIETAVCPECGKSYVSGGTTSTRIKYPADSEKAKEKNPLAETEDAGVDIPEEDAQRTPIARMGRTNPYAANQGQVRAAAVRGKGFDYATKPLEEFEMERY